MSWGLDKLKKKKRQNVLFWLSYPSSDLDYTTAIIKGDEHQQTNKMGGDREDKELVGLLAGEYG